MTAAHPASVDLTSVTRALPEGTDPLSGLGAGGVVWLHEGAGIATSGVAARIPLTAGSQRIALAAEHVAAVLGGIEVDDPLALPGTGPVAVGALPFLNQQEGELVIPARVVGRTPEGQAWVTEVSPSSRPPFRSEGRSGPGSSPAGERLRGAALEPTSFVVEADGGRLAWNASVRRALERIGAGTLSKVVLARRVVVWGDQPFSLPVVVDRLRRAHPSCFTFAIDGFVGASPELLVRRRGGRVWSRPMAGSVERGGSSADDRRLTSALRSSPKELDEHRFVVEDVRRRLDPLCRSISVNGPQVVGLSSVTHLATSVAGRLRSPPPSALALAGHLHPTPAVGGQPRDVALATIAELEGFDRGLYAGPVGWVDSRGDGDWAVALRCASVDGRRAVLSAGAGIVAGSDPDAEWAETQAKLEPMLRALVRV
ncbi:MAG: isochorismate synthase MenF [Acidimicrobiales bacterium]